jgi:tRNA-5-taurinomethyluridine 2-sulfurtransferase
MKNWDDKEETGSCDGARDAEDAEWVCKKLEIPFHQVNFVKEYWNSVFSDLLKEYSEGWTPNPDLLCNKYIKFDCFQKFAFGHLGADAVATGHYANNSLGHLLQDFASEKCTRIYCDCKFYCANFAGARLLMPKDLVKDQTFHLSQVAAEALNRAMFPLAHLLKSEVKQVAVEAGLSRIATKNESMGICFIGSRNFSNFIDQVLPLILKWAHKIIKHSSVH